MSTLWPFSKRLDLALDSAQASLARGCFDNYCACFAYAPRVSDERTDRLEAESKAEAMVSNKKAYEYDK